MIRTSGWFFRQETGPNMFNIWEMKKIIGEYAFFDLVANDMFRHYKQNGVMANAQFTTATIETFEQVKPTEGKFQ